MALDYLILYQIQESLNPGYLRRMERRMEQENAQSFLIRPSQHIPYGGGSRLFEGVR
jgi:polyphosphate kinase 2 (PPK2 family)